MLVILFCGGDTVIGNNLSNLGHTPNLTNNSTDMRTGTYGLSEPKIKMSWTPSLELEEIQ